MRSWTDAGLAAGTYWYALFAVNRGRKYSSGAVIPVTVTNATTAGPIQQPTAQNVTADGLPTVQIGNGAESGQTAGSDAVAWCQVVVGNTVYVGGDFTTARPAGAAPGVNTVPRHNVLAYDITTGNLIDSFADPNVNGVVRTIAAGPDGQPIYIGGDFLTVNGVSHPHLAALNPSGQLDTSFTGYTSDQVDAITLSPDGKSVYAGGNFLAANGAPRTRLAKFSTTGALDRNWLPAARGVVLSLLVTPDASKVVVGGSFPQLNSDTAVKGIGAVNNTNGASVTG